jgi:hypothetical protein
LRHQYERSVSGIEDLYDLGKISEASSQAVDLIDHDHLNPPGLHFGHQLDQAGPIHVSARKSAVVVDFGRQQPAFMPLTGDVGRAGFTLSIEAIERLFQALLSGFASVDGAAGDVDAIGWPRPIGVCWGRR